MKRENSCVKKEAENFSEDFGKMNKKVLISSISEGILDNQSKLISNQIKIHLKL